MLVFFFFTRQPLFSPISFSPLSFCFPCPGTSLKLLHANIPILPSPSLPPFSISPLLPLSSHSVRFDLTELSRLAVVPRLCGNVSAAPVSLINSPLSQSLLYFFFFFFAKPPTLSPPPFSFLPLHIRRAPFYHFAQLRSSAAYLLRLIHHYFHLLLFPFFGHLSKFCLIRSMLSGDLFLSKPPTPSPVPVIS